MRTSKALSVFLLMLGGLVAISSSANEKIESAATKILLDVCPTLVRLEKASEISNMSASFRSTEVSYEQEDLGWRDIIQVVVTLSSPVNSLPRDFYASGHVCTYDIGYGGIVTSKTPCKKICNFDTSDNGPAYLAVPATEALNLAVQ